MRQVPIELNFKTSEFYFIVSAHMKVLCALSSLLVKGTVSEGGECEWKLASCDSFASFFAHVFYIVCVSACARVRASMHVCVECVKH